MYKEHIARLKQQLRKFRYPALILVLGLLLLLLPGRKTENGDFQKTEDDTILSDETASLYIEEEKLGDLLSQIQGAGHVRVMLSLKTSAEFIYQVDDSQQGSDAGRLQENTTTILYKASSNKEQALVRQQVAPVYQGAIILCQGAENPSIKLALVQAVSDLTGLGSDCITVIKMK